MENNSLNNTNTSNQDDLEFDNDSILLDDTSDEEEEAAAKPSDTPHKESKAADILRKIVLVVAILVFLYSAGMLINIFSEYKQGTDTYNNIQERVLDSEQSTAVELEDEEVEIPFTYNHEQLLSINPEGIGYIYIPSSDLRFPMVQTTDNDYYLTHTFDHVENKSGCLFEDYRITGGLSASHVIIYGHNLKNNGMLAPLLRYRDESYYMTDNNDTFLIYTEDKIMQYRIFSVYISEPVSSTYTFNFSSQAALQKYANAMKAQSMYDTGVNIENVSQVVTLSTCTNDTKRRFIVHGAYVGEAKLSY